MLNDELDRLGVSSEWRSPHYYKKPRPAFDSEMFVETDPALTRLLSEDHSPNLELWRAVLRIWREVKDYRIAHKKARQAFENGERKKRPNNKRPNYAFEIDGRRYQTKINDDFDFQIIRHLGAGVTLSNNKTSLSRMALSEIMIDSLIGQKLGKIVEMEGVDQADYGNNVVKNAYRRGQSTILVLEGYPAYTPLLHFNGIEPLLDKQDRVKKKAITGLKIDMNC